MKRKLIYTFLAALTLLMSCEKFDEVHQEYVEGGEIRYSVKPDSIVVFAGLNRCKVMAQLPTTPNLDQLVIEWDEEKKSTVVPSDIDTAFMDVLIENMKEGSVIFNVYSTDKEGHHSVPSNAFGKVYGEKYQENLLPRNIMEIKGVKDGALVKFGSNPEKSVGVKINYLDNDDVLNTIYVDKTKTEVVLENSKYNSELSYTTLYLPEPNCIDTIPTFFPVKVLIPEPVLVEKIIDLYAFSVMELDNDVSNPVWGSKYSNLFDGKYTTYAAFDFSDTKNSMSFDLGEIFELTKLKVWFRLNSDAHYFGASNAKTIEIYSASEFPNSSDFSEWDLVGTYTFQKPSEGDGLTEEDKTVAKNGFECVIEGNIKARYLRIKVVENFNGSANFYFGNLEFYAYQI